jgi:hypothetical protein
MNNIRRNENNREGEIRISAANSGVSPSGRDCADSLRGEIVFEPEYRSHGGRPRT